MANVFGFLAQASGDPNLLLTTVLLPFLLVFVIFWGILRMVKIFGTDQTANKITLVVSLVVTIFVAFTDAWGLLATQLAAATGVFTYIMFFGVFILGTILWAIGRTQDVYHRSGLGTGHYNDLKALSKQLAKLYNKYKDAEYQGNKGKMEAIAGDIKKLEERRDILYKMSELKR
jgi:asparagine N-glycosylation enzyme membrane subunit Stt3